MRNIYLINEQTIRKASMIDDNVDASYLQYAIWTAQETSLQEILGSKLYESILSQVESGTFKAPEYKKLLDNLIQPYLTNEVTAQIIMPLQYKIRNAGVVIGNDQHYQSMSMADVERVQQSYMHKAAFFGNRMIEYIVDNKEVFWDDIECTERWLKIVNKVNKCPIYFNENK